MIKLKRKIVKHSHNIFKSSNKSNIFISFSIIFFSAYIKMSNDSSAKHYQDIKERLQKNKKKKKNLVKDVKVFV